MKTQRETRNAKLLTRNRFPGTLDPGLFLFGPVTFDFHPFSAACSFQGESETMVPVKLSDNMTDYLIRMGSAWVKRQREQYHPRGKPLPPETHASLAPFFFPETLESVRIVRVPLIENPAFYGTLLTSRKILLLDFRRATGIAFVDTVLLSSRFLSGPPPLSLLFHEIVHVVQYRLLGVSEFSRRYVLGWVENGYRYEAIPLEQQAYSLTARFVQSQEEFSVDLEVEKTMPTCAGKEETTE